MITVTLVTTSTELESAFSIRRAVFVDEQGVDAREEYDEFESESRHFLVRLHDRPIGTARWRRTTNGIKLERFAVLPDARGRGTGKALVQTVLNDVRTRPDAHPTVPIYLHAQIAAMPLYAGFGFEPVGERFVEAGIEHAKMVLRA
jgi:predicted GNAT family N-acyltransferase